MNISNYTKDLRSILGNQAFQNYLDHLTRIDEVKNGIKHNRKGHLPLTEITNDQDKLRKRIAREGYGIPKDVALERINGVPDFQDVAIIKKLVRHSKSICRIYVKDGFGASGYGTGFLIAPGILMTNNHVLPDPEIAKSSLAQFNYEIDEQGQMLNPVCFKLDPEKLFLTSAYKANSDDPLSGLDFTMVAVEALSNDSISIDQFGYIRLDPSLGKIIEGENCVVIQHPKGDYKKIVLKDIRMLTLSDNCLIYESDTLPGSSGSVVIGLGTGEVVALHHSSIPRIDSNGNWLRKDGSIAQAHDDDEDIDWIGNEGIRISRILEAVKNNPVYEKINAVKSPIFIQEENKNGQALLSQKTIIERKVERGDKQPDTQPKNTEQLQYFEVLLTDQEEFIEDWESRSRELIPNLQSNVPLIPSSMDPYNRRLYYLTVRSSKNPWTLAAEIENIPHVETCVPDLQTYTDVGISEANGSAKNLVESDIISRDEKPWNEPDFLCKWENSKTILSAKKIGGEYHRWWNWIAVNCPQDSVREIDPTWKSITGRLNKLRLVQLDTGYSTHSKVSGGWDLNQDFDFIDTDENAEDRMARGPLRHAAHGTRTASILVGNRISKDPGLLDGNGGLLTIGQKSNSKVIPYRIAQSVILIGRGKELTDAVKYAIRNNTDVMFTCMGSYPRPMFAAVAKEAYYNGIIWTCAAGNHVELIVAPAMYPGTIAVAAINPDEKPWSGSSNGYKVDIAAPGEDVYVPVFNNGNESMNYGSGTSYATPHIAAAAMLWKAKYLDILSKKYDYPWQFVEAFRYCLKKTARKPANWDSRYGAGILDLEALLDEPLPKKEDLKDAYAGVNDPQYKDPGVREVAHYIWNVILRKIKPGSTESLAGYDLTERGKQALAAFTSPTELSATESTHTAVNEIKMKSFIRDYFEQNI